MIANNLKNEFFPLSFFVCLFVSFFFLSFFLSLFLFEGQSFTIGLAGSELVM